MDDIMIEAIDATLSEWYDPVLTARDATALIRTITGTRKRYRHTIARRELAVAIAQAEVKAA